MKVVILAGGFGTRLAEETDVRPKPMVEIGGRPILWHIMKHYSHFGFNEFVLCLGYKGYVIKEYFANYALYSSDVTFDLINSEVTVHTKRTEPWKVTLIDTGYDSGTAGRLLHIQDHLKGEKDFCFTYGDGVSDINLTELVDSHRSSNLIATVTSVQPRSKYGVLNIGHKNVVKTFEEKPTEEGGWINGGFFVLSTQVLDYIEESGQHFEHGPMTKLVRDSQLNAYRHYGFWQSMDTLRDKNFLESLWQSQRAPWKLWE